MLNQTEMGPTADELRATLGTYDVRRKKKTKKTLERRADVTTHKHQIMLSLDDLGLKKDYKGYNVRKTLLW